MSTMVIVTSAMDAETLIPWGARLARGPKESLVVLCCFAGKPHRRATAVTAERLAEGDGMLSAAEDAINRLDDASVELLELQHSDLAKAILAEIRAMRPSLVLVGTDGNLPEKSPRVRLGERLLRVAPCDLLLLDPGDQDEVQCKRILVPMSRPHAEAALRTAMALAAPSGVVAPLWIGRYFGADSLEVARRELALVLRDAGVEPSETVQPAVFVAEHEENVILSESVNCDLMLFGSADARIIRRLRAGSPENPDEIADSRVAIGVLRPAGRAETGEERRWLPELSADDRVSLFDRIQSGSRLSADFTVMIGLSTAIAALGLVKNSTAMLIGAMLVAPLMTPLIGAALALVQGNVRLFQTSLKAMGFGVFCALCLSLLIGFLTPLEEMTSAIVERAEPDILDLVVALLSGMAAGYAFSRSTVAEAIVGVAVATALVPPLASVGVTLACYKPMLAKGAAILFATNLVAIILGAALSFRLLGVQVTRRGMRPLVWARRIILALVLVSILLSAPLGYKLADQIRAGQVRPLAFPVSKDVLDVIREHIQAQPGLRLVLAGRSSQEGNLTIGIILAAHKPIPASFVEELREAVRQARGKDITVKICILQEVVPVPNAKQKEPPPK